MLHSKVLVVSLGWGWVARCSSSYFSSVGVDPSPLLLVAPSQPSKMRAGFKGWLHVMWVGSPSWRMTRIAFVQQCLAYCRGTSVEFT